MNAGRRWSVLAGAALLAAGALSAAPDDDAPKGLPEAPRDEDFFKPADAVVALGRLLFFDKELSGNRDISCATCHSPQLATTDKHLSINIGTGGRGLGSARDAGAFPPGPLDPVERGQRNMIQLFNLGHKEFSRFFWDGRLQTDPGHPSGFDGPAGNEMPHGFRHLIEAVSIFAPTERQEMTGRPGTNELADASVASPFTGVWNGLVARLKAIEEYRQLFVAAFPDLGGNADGLTIVHVGKAIGAFQAEAFRSDDSPFDRYLRGERDALSRSQRAGLKLFYGKAGCSGCHSGAFQTDHGFHAIGIPQVGPGFGGVGQDGREDFGREGVTGQAADRYRFRTPSLRNVALTAPYGHDGFYATLEGVVRHHLDPQRSLENADPSQVQLPSRPDLDALDYVAFNNPAVRTAIAGRIVLAPRTLSPQEFGELIDFLHALTDPSAHDLGRTVPARVPSGLPLGD